MKFKIINGGRGAILRMYNIVSTCGSYYVDATGKVTAYPASHQVPFYHQAGSFAKVEAERWIDTEVFYQESLV